MLSDAGVKLEKHKVCTYSVRTLVVDVLKTFCS